MPEKKKQDNKIIKKKTRVSVSNTLNQMVFEQKDMNLQAFRMLMFYLAKINPKRPDFTEVKISLEAYAEMLGVELNEKAIDESTNLLLGYILKTGERIEGGYKIINAKYNIFSVCRLVERLSDGKRMLEFKCSEDIKPLIFDIKEQFTAFSVWNVLNLSNFQDIRMYMLLSQYKVAGSRTLTLEELKKHLGIDKDAYPEYKIFARDVLKKCQKALKERTDICFEFKAVGRPARSICFEISPNADYKILKYLDETEEAPQLPEQSRGYAYGNEQCEQVNMFTDADEFEKRSKICAGFDDEIFLEFRLEQLQELKDLAWANVDDDVVERHYAVLYDRRVAREYAVSEYIRQKIRYCNAYPEPVPYRYKFIKAAVEGNWR